MSASAISSAASALHAAQRAHRLGSSSAFARRRAVRRQSTRRSARRDRLRAAQTDASGSRAHEIPEIRRGFRDRRDDIAELCGASCGARSCLSALPSARCARSRPASPSTRARASFGAESFGAVAMAAASDRRSALRSWRRVSPAWPFGSGRGACRRRHGHDRPVNCSVDVNQYLGSAITTFRPGALSSSLSSPPCSRATAAARLKPKARARARPALLQPHEPLDRARAVGLGDARPAIGDTISTTRSSSGCARQRRSPAGAPSAASGAGAHI